VKTHTRGDQRDDGGERAEIRACYLRSPAGLFLARLFFPPPLDSPPPALLVLWLFAPPLGARLLAVFSELPAVDEALEFASELPLSLLAEALSEPASDLFESDEDEEDEPGEALRA